MASNQPRSNLDAISTYAEVAVKGEQVRQLLAKRLVKLHPQSALAALFSHSEELKAEWENSGQTRRGEELLMSALQTNRICDAIVGAGNEPAALECLRRIAKKDMNLQSHEPSQGKDALFELEVLHYLRHHGMPTAKMSEPDIVVPMSWGDYPIACKKINSLANTDKQIGSACKQLAASAGMGVIALSVDVMVPEASFIKVATYVESERILKTLTEKFIDDHRSRMQDVVAAERCDGFYLSISAAVKIDDERPQQNYHTEILFWNLADINPAGAKRFKDFARIAFASVPGRSADGPV